MLARALGADVRGREGGHVGAFDPMDDMGIGGNLIFMNKFRQGTIQRQDLGQIICASATIEKLCS